MREEGDKDCDYLRIIQTFDLAKALPDLEKHSRFRFPNRHWRSRNKICCGVFGHLDFLWQRFTWSSVRNSQLEKAKENGKKSEKCRGSTYRSHQAAPIKLKQVVNEIVIGKTR